MHLVGFIKRIHHYARSPELQTQIIMSGFFVKNIPVVLHS